MTERFKLFESICLPSVKSQTLQEFTWLVYFDSKTSEQFLKRISSLHEQYDRFEPRYCERLTLDRVVSDISSVSPVNARRLLTTRLDNDDALHPDYLRTVFEHAGDPGLYFINFPRGLVTRSGKFYEKTDFSNPFISLAEPLEKPRTVWVDQHHRLAAHAPIRQVPEYRYAWIQVIHTGNAANRVRGLRVRRENVPTSVLPPSLRQGETARESLLELIYENTCMQVIWKIRGAWTRLLNALRA